MGESKFVVKLNLPECSTFPGRQAWPYIFINFIYRVHKVERKVGQRRQIKQAELKPKQLLRSPEALCPKADLIGSDN